MSLLIENDIDFCDWFVNSLNFSVISLLSSETERSDFVTYFHQRFILFDEKQLIHTGCLKEYNISVINFVNRFCENVVNLLLVFLLLITTNLTTHRLYLFSRLWITIKLPLTCFSSHNILVVTLVKYAISFPIEYTDRKITTMAKYYCYFFCIL